MKYTLSINQKAAFDCGLDEELDLSDLAILSIIKHIIGMSRVVTTVNEGTTYFWLSYQHISNELPILKMKEDSVYRRIKKYISLGLMSANPLNSGGRTYFSISKKFDMLFSDTSKNDSDTPTDENPTLRMKIRTPTDGNPNPHIYVKPNTTNSKEIYKEKESGHTYKEYVDYINSKTGKRYRGDSTSSKSFGVRLKKYTFEELKSVVDNATQDEYHKGNNFMYLTPEFLLRETKIEKFLNSQSKPIGLTEEEKGRLQRLDQYHQFDGKDYMVEKGIWEEYQDLKKRYAVHTNK